MYKCDQVASDTNQLLSHDLVLPRLAPVRCVLVPYHHASHPHLSLIIYTTTPALTIRGVDFLDFPCFMSMIGVHYPWWQDGYVVTR